MDWTISITLVLILTSLTGSVVFGIWYMIGKLLEITGFVNVMYELLKAVLCFFYVPLSFLILFLGNRVIWGGIVFHETPLIKSVCCLFILVWMVGGCILMARYVMENWMLLQRFHSLTPVDGDVLEYYESVCQELGVKIGKVDLVQDYRAKVPFIGGMRRLYIVLPVREYTREQLRVIFVHELTHYKQKNHLLRHFTAIAVALHFFNPVIWLFRRKIQYWGEVACDYESIPKTDGLKAYFQVIVSMSMEEILKSQFLQTQLFFNTDHLDRRMKQMKRTYRIKKKPKFLAVFVVCGMISISATSVCGATTAAGDTYYNVYEKTVVMETEVSAKAEDTLIEYEVGAFDTDFVVEEGTVTTNARTVSNFQWTIKANRIMTSGSFSCKSGKTVTLFTAIDPSTAKIRMGIIEPDGTIRYVNVTNYGTHEFTLDQTGKYYIFIQNMSDKTIDVGGTYKY